MVKKLPLQDCQATRIFRGIDAKLRNDPVLRRVVKKWCTFSGDDSEVTEPTNKDFPYIRLEAAGNRSHRETEGTTLSPMNMTITLIVEGTRMDDIANLWDQVRKVLMPGDGTMKQFLGQDATGMNLGKPVYGVETVQESRCLVAQGTLEIMLYVSTGL